MHGILFNRWVCLLVSCPQSYWWIQMIIYLYFDWLLFQRSHDGKYLAISSQDGYSTLVEFENGELGSPFLLSGLPLLLQLHILLHPISIHSKVFIFILIQKLRVSRVMRRRALSSSPRPWRLKKLHKLLLFQ